MGISLNAHAEVITCTIPAVYPKPILPNTKFNELPCRLELNLAGAPNEIIAGSFIVRSSATIPDMILKPSSLTSTTGASIPADAIDLRYVKVWYQSGNAWQSITQDKSKRVLVPELLLHNSDLVQVDEGLQRNYLIDRNGRKIDINKTADNALPDVISIDDYPISDSKTLQSLNLKADANQQLWITIKPDASTQPGQYRGKISIDSARANIHQEVPVTLTVHPFNLADPTLLYGLYYRGTLTTDNKGSISSEKKSIAQMSAELKNLSEHGVKNPTIYQPGKPASLFETVLQLRESAGMDNSELFYLGVQPGIPVTRWEQQGKEAEFFTIRSIARRHKNNKLHLYAIDEADPELVPKQKPVWSKYKNLGAEIFAADWKAGAESIYAGEIGALVLGTEVNRSNVGLLRSKGTRAFLYNRPQVGVENPYVYRLQYGLVAWRNDYDGVMNYAYQHAMGNIWNDFDHPQFRDHVFAYPTSDGVIDTIAWEGFREGVTDVRYISTLEKLAKLRGSAADMNYLSSLKNGNERDLDSMRATLATRISALCQQFSKEQLPDGCSSSAPSPIREIQVTQPPN